MSIFNFLGSLFKPAAELIDNIHTSEEEKGNIEVKKAEIKGKLAEIEASVSTKMMDLQLKSIEANTKLEQSIQEHGNWYTKSIRPTLSLLSFLMMILMGMGFMEMNELIIKICGGYLGVYAGLRSYEKSKK